MLQPQARRRQERAPLRLVARSEDTLRYRSVCGVVPPVGMRHSDRAVKAMLAERRRVCPAESNLELRRACVCVEDGLGRS